MISDTASSTTRPASTFRLRDLGREHLALLVGLLLLAIPSLITLAREAWPMDANAHGPIVLATGLWLLVHNRFARDGRAGAGGSIRWLLVALPALALYAFGRAYDFLFLEVAGLYVAGIVAALILAGWAEVRRNLFPFFYLAFVIPPPGWLIDRITAPLQTFVSFAALHLIEPLGYPIAREGVTLMIGPYQLLVEDACAGMNSLVGLTAISLFYIYLMHRASWRYATVLVALIVPIAIFVNVLRVVALVLITYYFGDAVAQGMLHVTTGLVLFTLALALMILADRVLQAIVAYRNRSAR